MSAPAHSIHLAPHVNVDHRTLTLLLAIPAIALLLPLLALPFVGRR
jgi:hypothetical protein